MLDPASRLKTVTEICEAAGCSRNCYYESFKKTEFAELVRQRSKELVARAAPMLVNAFLREALRGSFQHGKVLLEMAELYQESKALTGANGAPLIPSRPAGLPSHEELLAMSEEELARLQQELLSAGQ